MSQVLLDMRAAGAELGWLRSPQEEGWELLQTVVNGSMFYTYSVCNVAGGDQDNWLRTTFIQRRPAASRVFVELRFIVRDCNSFDGASLACKETFNMYAAESDADVGTSFRKGLFRKVATVAPDEISVRGELRVNTETKVVESLSHKGFYLAFQDLGGCVALLSVRVYYKSCPATVLGLATFPDTVAGVDGVALREVSGQCVPNAISSEMPRIHCTLEGEWVVPVGQCQCQPGFEALNNSCRGSSLMCSETAETQSLWCHTGARGRAAAFRWLHGGECGQRGDSRSRSPLCTTCQPSECGKAQGKPEGGFKGGRRSARRWPDVARAGVLSPATVGTHSTPGAEVSTSHNPRLLDIVMSVALGSNGAKKDRLKLFMTNVYWNSGTQQELS
ncbi:hypothetical protein Z043_108132, partial [Scleropages formosus]